MGAKTLHPVLQCGKVSGGIAEATILLAHDQWQRQTITSEESRRVDADRTPIALRDSEALQLGDNWLELRVVAALGGRVLLAKCDVQPRVQRLDISRGCIDQVAPQLQCGRIALLQKHDAASRALCKGGITVELEPRCPVEPRQGVHIAAVRGDAFIEHLLDEHPKRRAPVADMVLADDVVTQILQRSRQAIADDRAAQVPDMHFLRQIRRGVVHDHGLRALGSFDPQAYVLMHAAKPRGQIFRAASQVDETRPRHHGALENLAQRQSGHDGCGNLPWIALDLACEPQRNVDLVVRMLRAPHGNLDRADSGAEQRLDGASNQPVQITRGIDHDQLSMRSLLP